MALGAAYAKGKWALGECARSGRKMLLRNMVADGYYPNLIVDPEWYEPKHPQESLPKVRDPTALFRPAPERDRISAVLALGGVAGLDAVPGGGFGMPFDGVLSTPGGQGSGARGASLAFGYELGNIIPNFVPNPPAIPVGNFIPVSSPGNPEPFSGGIRIDWFFRADGTRVWTIRDSLNRADQFDVSPPWGFTWTNQVSDTSGFFNDPRSIVITPDGTKLLWNSGGVGGNVRSVILTTPFDIGTLGTAALKFVKSSQGQMRWKTDGLKVWINSGAGTDLDAYAVSLAFDISTINTTAVESFDMTVDAGVGVDTFALSAGGTKLYANTSLDLLCSWDLSTPFDISTAGSFATGVSINLPSTLSVPRGMLVRPDNGFIFLERDQALQNVRVFGTP